jgi:hypothetical protein
MLNQQINIISTDIHNLTLIQQGDMAQLPNTEELTENAVKAEEMLETLRADAELVGGLETGMEAALVSADELAILKEFESSAGEGEAESSAPAAQERQATSSPVRETPAAQADTTPIPRTEEAPPTRVEPERDQAGPEAS